MSTGPFDQPLPPRLAAALGDRYRIEREIGAGGMATVYLADDIKHHRKVAIKVLRPDLAATLGSDRFLREIQVAARLQHPHILPLHDSGEADGFLYYVMPYAEGDSLRQRIATAGEFPISDAIRILTEVVDALAYAHARGIVHRDMKPDNIMLSGRHPLVMDFGIAKAVSLATGVAESTTGGLALGTPAYMSPEQAVADPRVDHRADIYALGVIAYELLSGQPPFTGMPAAEIMTAQVTQAPVPIAERRPGVPPVLAAMVMRCLAKRPSDRPQDASELLVTLVALATPSGGREPTGARIVSGSSTVARGRRWRWPVGALIVGSAVLGLGYWRTRPSVKSAPELKRTQLTFTGTALDPDISPDGKSIAYVERGDTNRLVVRDLASGSTLRLGTADAARLRPPRWSGDGAWLLRTVATPDRQIASELIPRLGGDPRPLPALGLAALSPDGTTLAVWDQPRGSPITLTTLATGAVHSIAVPDSVGWHTDVEWSPDQRFLALMAFSESGSPSTLWTYDLKDQRWQMIVSDSLSLSSPRWSPTQDAIYYLRGKHVGESELRVIRLGSNASPRGHPRVLQLGLGADRNDGWPMMSISADGNRLVYAKGLGRQNIWLAARATEGAPFTISQLTFGTAPKSQASLSPDGTQVAFIQADGDRADVFVVGTKREAPRRVTSHGRVEWGSVAWSPGGDRLAYGRQTDAGVRVSTVGVDGQGERIYERSTLSMGSDLSWAPGSQILHLPLGNQSMSWLDPASESERPLTESDSIGWMFFPVPSPNGRSVSVFSYRQAEGARTYVISRDEGLARPVGPENGRPLGWSANGEQVYIISHGRQLWRAPRTGKRQDRIGTVPFADPDGPDCSVREKGAGLLLLCVVDEVPVTDIWMLENFDPERRPK